MKSRRKFNPAPPAGGRTGKGRRRGKGKGDKDKRKPKQLLTKEESAISFSNEFAERVVRREAPRNQVKLSLEQLKEEHQRIIKAQDPNVATNVIEFSYHDRVYRKRDAALDHMAVHFSMPGVYTLKETDSSTPTPVVPPVEMKSSATGTEDAAAGPDDASAGPGKQLKNQFNFSERASQTFTNPKRSRGVITEPPPHNDFSDNVSQWSIFDTYLNEVKKAYEAKMAKEAERTQTRHGKKTKEEPLQLIPDHQVAGDKKILECNSLARSVKIMERIINQISETNVFHEYKYEHQDAKVENEEFFKLWTFTASKASRKTVTGLKWNPTYHDMFAVAYGSYDFLQQGTGAVCVFSLKNTRHPEFTITTEAGAMCLDWHPQYPSLLAVGLYDGTVAVYDVKAKNNEPIYVSNNPKVKHTDPVWEVRWQAQDNTNKSINFFSISSDGRVTNWVVRKNELVNEEIQELKLGPRKTATNDDDDDMNEATLVGMSGGTCFDFNPKHPHLFVVGTEEGTVQSYSKAYSNQQQYLQSYESHHMVVYAVKWNPFHSNVFLTCSADWTVKLWEQHATKPVITFDLANSVSDIQWAPYSSTVFATITTDGWLKIYDLQHKNKHEPIGKKLLFPRQRERRVQLTHVAFNPTEPVLLVGDDAGTVTCFKLAPKVYKKTMSAPHVWDIDPTAETQKLEQLLLLADVSKDQVVAPAGTTNFDSTE